MSNEKPKLNIGEAPPEKPVFTATQWMNAEVRHMAERSNWLLVVQAMIHKFGGSVCISTDDLVACDPHAEIVQTPDFENRCVVFTVNIQEAAT